MCRTNISNSSIILCVELTSVTRVKRDESSANSVMIDKTFAGRSLMYTKKSNGPKGDP